MKIAIIGSGISGMTAAWMLSPHYDITVFEANDYIGGHTNTVPVEMPDREYWIDTGFIVHNDWTYPNFIKLMDHLDVTREPTEMSFSVKDEITGLEYNGTSINTMFAQRRNLLNPKFFLMIRDILRFNKEAVLLLEAEDDSLTLGEYLKHKRYSSQFIEQYLLPMGGAIWSTDLSQMMAFPALYFIRFFKNHGLLTVNGHPQWYVIQGGSYQYIDKLTKPYRDRIRLKTPVEWVQRHDLGVAVKPMQGDVEHYDKVIFATHSDQSLQLLADASDLEREILGAIPYQKNIATLHTDSSLMPKTRLAWASWNYHRLKAPKKQVTVSYNMNILQNLPAPHDFIVTLNHEEAIDPAKILKQIVYHHPVYNRSSVAAQQRQEELNGVRNTYFCGAYWRYGFHEDGVVSALNVAKHFGRNLDEIIEAAQWTTAEVPNLIDPPQKVAS